MKHSINIVNKKVKFEYEFIDNYTAGIMLVGTEVKAVREGNVSIVDAFCIFHNGELFLKNVIITNDGTAYPHDPARDRKLLLNRKELKRLGKDLIDGLTVIPYRLFINDKGLIKVHIVLAKGKKLYDKRQTIKKRDIERDIKNLL